MPPPYTTDDLNLLPIKLPAQKAYAEALLNRLTHKTASLAGAKSPPIRASLIIDQLTQEGKIDSIFIEVVLRERIQRTIGFIVVSPSFPLPQMAHIQLIVVDSSYRGKGTGTLVLKLLEDHFSHVHGFQNISLQITPPDPRVVRFWEKNGYIQYGTPMKIIPTHTQRVISGITLTKDLNLGADRRSIA